ncbi:MAG: SAM-dependent chlorinase/fluorinase [Pseudomonadota bacterium]
MAAKAIITLTTDFGLKDNYVGVMKGVILGLNPEARLVDLGHELPPHDAFQAAFFIYSAHAYFPAGAIHLVVVDPGVGSERAILAIKTGGQIFIAPDNGLVSYILDVRPDFVARRIENQDLMLPAISRTFHGRDIMAPAAAHLSNGVALEAVGPETKDIVRLPTLKPELKPDLIQGRVIYVDRFGNLITNIPVSEVEARAGGGLVIQAGPVRLNALAPNYQTAAPGEYLAVGGSSGFLEIARNQKPAHRPPELTLGTPVLVRRHD